jgi:hypothetical protein
MRFIPAEPDIATVFRRITEGDIDLQPDFQRGEVWSVTKQQRLIDTILRGWVIPPVLLVSNGSGQQQQVLDGQQRLASIRDFMLNQFAVDGEVEPIDTTIKTLHGTRFAELPHEMKRAFLRTPIRMYEISDYKPEEPAEIFFRLNQPTGLTPAEKRNAFFGPIRDQIRKLVERFQQQEIVNRSHLGFSNSRMAYDDVFARFAFTLESGSLTSKVTATVVDQLYRRRTPLPGKIVERLESSIDKAVAVFSATAPISAAKGIKLNKATFYSWLVFFCRMPDVPVQAISRFFIEFETLRTNASFHPRGNSAIHDYLTPIFSVYNDRASARVADVSSVLLRDMCLWAAWAQLERFTPSWHDSSYSGLLNFLASARKFTDDDAFETRMLEFIDSSNWAQVLG